MVVLEKALAVGVGGIVSPNVRMRARRRSSSHGYTVIAGLGGRPITQGLAARLLADAAADRLQPLSFLDLDWDVVERELARMRASRALRPARREHPARRRPDRRGAGVRGREHERAAIRFYQTGSFAVGNRLLDREQRSVQADEQRTNSITCGPPRLPGLRRGARRALRARRRDARHRTGS